VGVPALTEPVEPGRSFESCIARIANDCATTRSANTDRPARNHQPPRLRRPGLRIMSDAAREAIQILARREAILADPVYTGKALAALVDHVRRGLIARDRKICFIHTGGIPALFAYAESLAIGRLTAEAHAPLDSEHIARCLSALAVALLLESDYVTAFLGRCGSPFCRHS